MLDWIFEGIVTWISNAATKLMDAVSGLFLNALGTDMTAMEEYFPFVTKAFSAMQYTAWAILFLIFVWQLFRVFGGPVTEAENPLVLLARSAIFALLIGYAKSIFMIVLNIARAPYTALMDISMSAEDFTFAGIEEVLKNGMTTLLAEASGIGTLLIAILMISLGWNYFKLLLETVERYVVVGVLCYTSPLAYSLGGSMTTAKVFSSWCRMIGSQLLLLVMNVWFLRAFDSSVGYFIGTGGTLTTGQGSIFLWMFCALAFLKTAQRFDSYLASMGLNVAQTGSSMGMEMLMAARVIGGAANVGGRTVGSVFKGGSGAASATATGTGAAASGFASGFASQFKGNSYVRDAVVSGGSGNMGVGGAVGFVARTFGGIAARNGVSLTAESVSSVAARSPSVSGTIAGDIADRSLSNYMPQFGGKQLKGTQITGGHISTKAVGADGKSANVELFNTAQYDKPEGPHSIVTAADGSTWYQVASGAGANEFYASPTFTGSPDEAAQVVAQFPEAEEGTILRTVDDGQIEATMPDGSNSMWYSSAFFDEPDAPHTTMEAADGVEWYAMQPNGEAPTFETLLVSGMETAFTDGGETVSATGGEAADIPQGDMPAQGTPPESVPFYETAPPETIEQGTPISEGTPPEVSAPDAQFYQGSVPETGQPGVLSYEETPPEVSAPDAQFYQGSAPDAGQPGVSFYEETPPEVSAPDAQFYQGSGFRTQVSRACRSTKERLRKPVSRTLRSTAEQRREADSRVRRPTKERIRKRHRQAAASMEHRSLKPAVTARKAHRFMTARRSRERMPVQNTLHRRLSMPTTVRSSSRSCPASSSPSSRWTALAAGKDGSRCGMKTAAARASMTRPSMRHPRATIRFMRMPRAASGTPSAASRPWREDLSTRTASLFMRAAA